VRFSAPWLARLLVGIPAVAGFYQFGCDQFDWPKLPALWGMTGAGLPWWGWLLIAQAGFVYALFEYVRRSQWPAYDDAPLKAKIAEVNTFAGALGEALGKETNENLERIEGKLDLTIKLFGERLEKLEKGTTQTGDLGKRNEASLAATLVVLKEQREAADEMAKELREAAVHALAEQREFQEKMEAWVGQLQRKIRFGLRGADQGFAAILDRECLLEMAAEIQDIGDELSGPTNGEALSDREGWTAKYSAWHRIVEEWSRLAANHREGVVGRVFDTPPREYKGKWKVTDDLFPDSNAVHDYKTFRIILRNFQAERKHVDYCLLLAAFAHPSMKVQGDPEDDDEMLSLPPSPEVQP
jgi:hypothetical protein